MVAATTTTKTPAAMTTMTITEITSIEREKIKIFTIEFSSLFPTDCQLHNTENAFHTIYPFSKQLTRMF